MLCKEVMRAMKYENLMVSFVKIQNLRAIIVVSNGDRVTKLAGSNKKESIVETRTCS